VNASPGSSDENPQGLKTQEGIGLLAGLIPLLVVTDCCLGQSLEGAAARAGVMSFGEWQAKADKRQEGMGLR
jgi:hypothetical protein